MTEQFDIQVMLADGTFADYIVKTERDSDVYQVFSNSEHLASFRASEGEWILEDNTGNLETDLQSRLKEQLKGLRT
ncbi:hypothetical protein [Pararcticibacter amylolyticus]|uniref:Uncharacterized protein n=1 Tax=Pararcticibacter amylolyticus TaxID=2173175 RepID=A0A2U2PCE5_9SPHI|nr:hypothetical protein [Pararcticibacter amylolyticus]PWG79076.1 hypothetical protein DDR33_18650 [Pararcticibacter amylolyticus]